MKLKSIRLLNQNIKENDVLDAIHSCYNDRCFSTFPYITYKLTSSKESMEQYNSGNCIALSMYIKKYLEVNHRPPIKSYIITASVPKEYKLEGQPHICHVSLLIPITHTSFYIIDCPFYFLNPMFCDLENNVMRQIESMNIHNNIREIIHYKLQNAEQRPDILRNTVECICYFINKPEDTWSYYINETLDPDNEIGKFFIQLKPQPFLCKTMTDKNGDIIKLYHIKIDNNGDFIFIENREEIYRGPLHKLPKRIKIIIKKKLYPYFDNFI